MIEPPLAIVDGDQEPWIRDVCPARIVDVLKFDVPVDNPTSMDISVSLDTNSNVSPPFHGASVRRTFERLGAPQSHADHSVIW
jgi:hypothetical protein